MSHITHPLDFTGKVALVTGAGSGIGRASAVAFAALGASVVVSDIDRDGGETTVGMIHEAGGAAAFVRADVARADDVAALVRAAIGRYGRLDCAHNNAGVLSGGGSVVEMTEETWQRVLSVNLTGVWLCMKYELPPMLARGAGAIVNTASVAGLTGFAGASAYTASKHGVIGLTRAAAKEVATSGVRVNAVCPGFIETPMIQPIMSAERRAVVEAAHAMGRFGTPEEVAQLVVWLCSDAAAFVTGAAYAVDGGFLA